MSHQGEVQEARDLAVRPAGRGFFVTLEGIDRWGKTTQVARLCAALAGRGLPVGVAGVPGGSLREPGGTPAGEAIRDVLLHRAHDVGPWTEALLYAAARAQLVTDVVRPSLEAGLIVVLDRYVDSSLAYQGWARGLGVDAVIQVNERATGGLWPDLTLLLRVAPSGRPAAPVGRPIGSSPRARRCRGAWPPATTSSRGATPSASSPSTASVRSTTSPAVERATLAALRRRGLRGRRHPCRLEAQAGQRRGAARRRRGPFADIPGQARAKAYVAGALARGAGHAYLLAGPEGLGKRRFALELGAAWWPPAAAAGTAPSASASPAARTPTWS